MAPMSGITNLPFRLIVKRLGAGLVTTEMISAMGLIRNHEKTFRYLQSSQEEKPLSVQIFGYDPHVMAEATEMVVDTCADIVDINMGCPVKKIVKTGAGAALMNKPQTAAAIVSSIRKAVDIPVTVKIRAGWSQNSESGGIPTAVEVAKLMEDAGADSIVVHPRTRTQGFSGQAAWSIIGEVASALTIPVIGNGDIRSGKDAVCMLDETGCDAVMIGRAAIGAPWIFRDIAAALTGKETPAPPTTDEIYSCAQKHLGLMIEHIGEIGRAHV